ncbi:MAG: hypothetical protein Q8900_13515 [Bacillota bacterium]|nr:hypothetical protein [Bacillota bacterium]
MLLIIDNVEIAAYPEELKFSLKDEDSENSQRTSDGTMHRDRIAVKRQLDLTFGILTLAQISSILKATSLEFFQFYYPDLMDGGYSTRIFYVGDRSAVTISDGENGNLICKGLAFTFIEQ